MSKFNDIKYMNDVIDTDVLLVEYNKNKMYINKLIEKDPKTLVNILWKILTNDKYCMIQMNKENMNDNVISCVNCQNIIELTTENLYDLFKFNDDYMMITSCELSLIYLKYVTNNKIKGDNFTIKILVTFYIEHLFKNSKIPHALNMITSYICNHVGYSLYKMPTIEGNLYALSSLVETLDYDILNSIMYSIMIQLIVIFNELHKIKFSFGNPTINAFLFDSKKCNYVYDNFMIESDYTMILSDLSKSSMMVNNVLFFPECNKINNIVNNNFIDIGYQLKDNHYIIHDYLIDGIMDYVKYKLPTSVDFYLVILSMVQDPTVYDIIINNEKCNKLWNLIWSGQTIDIKSNSLKNIKLHLNPTNYILTNL